MKTIVLGFCGLVNNISSAFEGRLGASNPEMAKMRAEVMHGEIPGIAEDRSNLRNDGKNIVGDIKKAYDEYLEDHPQYR
ncbi:MAG: hypothetical protein KF744_14470 [Taibaiella sp.]|nr:hypothetical protein [Taibaiella sp.]